MKAGKFALKMKNGVGVRKLQELRENFDLEQITAYFLNGKLETWLEDRYYDEELEQIRKLNKEDSELQKKLCQIFGVEYVAGSLTTDEIEVRNQNLVRLKEITDDEEILAHADSVAFSQKDLVALLEKGLDTIYLCGEKFSIPERIKNKTYIGIQTKLEISPEKRKSYERNGIQLVNILNTSRATTDIHMVLLWKDSDEENENFLVSVDEEKELYHPDIAGIEYRVFMKKINAPNSLRYTDVVYTGEKIVFQAEGKEGEFLAEMDTGGGNVRVLSNRVSQKRWLGIRNAIYFYRNKYWRVSYENAIAEDVSKFSMFGTSTTRCRIETSNAWYVFDNSSYGTFDITVLKEGETQAVQFRREPERGKDGTVGSRLISASWEKETDNIYLLLGDSIRRMGGGGKGRFYRYDIKTKKVYKAGSRFVFYGSDGIFCVKDNIAYYYGGISEANNNGKIMTFDMKTGERKCLWDIEELKKYEKDRGALPKKVTAKACHVQQIFLMGEYLYFYFIKDRDTENIERIYRIKTDGTERTIIMNPFGEQA